MKPSFCTLLMASAMIGLSHAEVPQKAQLTKYEKLWKFSPFTAKPLGETGPVYNPLENYVLLGVSPIKEGYRVTLLNKKNPAEKRIVVETHKPTEGFEILGVIRQKGNPRGTVVKLSRQGNTGTVGFEDKFLTLVQPVAKPREDVQQGAPPAPDGGKPHIVPKIPRASIVQPPATPGMPPAGVVPPKPGEGRSTRRFNR